MASKEENLPTPENVAILATKKSTLSRIALIGIFGSDANPSALLREDYGSFARVTIGDSFNGGVVEAIGTDSLILSRGGKTKVMKLPRV